MCQITLLKIYNACLVNRGIIAIILFKWFSEPYHVLHSGIFCTISKIEIHD